MRYSPEEYASIIHRIHIALARNNNVEVQLLREQLVEFNNTIEAQRLLYRSFKEFENDENIQNATFFLDWFLEPGEADEVIGDLIEVYARYARKSPVKARVYIIAQTIRVLIDWGLKLLQRFARARAGK